jgi:hypothetical protein
VKHAPHLSKQAKLVKLADKLYNLRDLLRAPVPGWYVSWKLKQLALPASRFEMHSLVED